MKEMKMILDLRMLSIDLSNYCSKQCPFCYNHSSRKGNIMWTPDEVISFAKDCINNGVKAISLGGGEPFEYDGIFDIIKALYPICYLTVTSNGLPLLIDKKWEMLKRCKPDKIHISLHNPDNLQELQMAKEMMTRLADIGIKPGVNLLVSNKKLDAASYAYESLLEVITRGQIILIPQRFSDTPTAKELAIVASNKPFQSPSCLMECRQPADFVSVSWDKKVSSCSYAKGKTPLPSLDFKGLTEALSQTNWHQYSCK